VMEHNSPVIRKITSVPPKSQNLEREISWL